uniref:Uncharacterized protein n=1 Tax=Arundo donax TaxID=35708 RepID=A0A0A9REW9_ARUDO
MLQLPQEDVLGVAERHVCVPNVQRLQPPERLNSTGWQAGNICVPEAQILERDHLANALQVALLQASAAP